MDKEIQEAYNKYFKDELTWGELLATINEIWKRFTGQLLFTHS